MTKEGEKDVREKVNYYLKEGDTFEAARQAAMGGLKSYSKDLYGKFIKETEREAKKGNKMYSDQYIKHAIKSAKLGPERLVGFYNAVGNTDKAVDAAMKIKSNKRAKALLNNQMQKLAKEGHYADALKIAKKINNKNADAYSEKLSKIEEEVRKIGGPTAGQLGKFSEKARKKAAIMASWAGLERLAHEYEFTLPKPWAGFVANGVHLYILLSLGGIIGAIFFLSPNLTGNAIANMTSSDSNGLGIILLIFGLVGAFFCVKK